MLLGSRFRLGSFGVGCEGMEWVGGGCVGFVWMIKMMFLRMFLDTAMSLLF